MFQLLWLNFMQNPCGLTHWQISGMGMLVKHMKLKPLSHSFAVYFVLHLVLRRRYCQFFMIEYTKVALVLLQLGTLGDHLAYN